MDLFLSHNPYKIETVFRIDDKTCDARWFTDMTNRDGSPSRLQMWIGQFFDKLHATYPEKTNFHLAFKGTSTDCLDIEEEANLAAARLGIEISVVTQPCANPASKFDSLRNLYKEAIAGPYEDFHSVELGEDFKKIEDRLLSVSIMAPMKNGKSTLLNAILGQELLPNATQRCTAKISYIEHGKGKKGFEAKSISMDGKSSDYLPCDVEMLKQWNADANVRHVHIRGPFPGMRGDDYRLQFVDTPGPDSAVHKEDRITIERFLNDNSLPMVCYIVDRINETEERYLKRLKEHMRRCGKQSEDRFIFIVSRMDQIDISKGDTKDENPIKTKIEKIREDLRALGIKNPRIIPVSAKIALKARTYRTLDEEDREEAIADFKKFQRGLRRIDSTLLQYTSVGSAIQNQIESETGAILKKIENGTDKLTDNLRFEELLSGIPTLEMAIEEYGNKYSVPARIYDAATIFEQGIQKANAVESLLGELSSRRTSLEVVGKNIEKLRHFLSKGKGAQAMRATMFPETWVESPTLKKELSTAERDFDIQIREKLADWNPQTRDKNGNIAPDEAEELARDFIEFMDGLSAEMLGVYANHVEDDARSAYKQLKADYEERLEEIMGEMPKELKKFFAKVRCVLPSNEKMRLNANDYIYNITETYTETFWRKITLEKDGFWKTLWSHLPFTDTEVKEERERTRTIQKVNYSDFKRDAKQEASNLIQAGVEKALAAAKGQYGELRKLMMKQFDSIDAKLSEFKKELERNLSEKEGEAQKIEDYSKILNWVKQFQEKLSHVLDLEA